MIENLGVLTVGSVGEKAEMKPFGNLIGNLFVCASFPFPLTVASPWNPKKNHRGPRDPIGIQKENDRGPVGISRGSKMIIRD